MAPLVEKHPDFITSAGSATTFQNNLSAQRFCWAVDCTSAEVSEVNHTPSVGLERLLKANNDTSPEKLEGDQERNIEKRSNHVSSLSAKRWKLSDNELVRSKRKLGEIFCSRSWGNLLSFNRALHAVFSVVPPPENNIHGCMAAFFGRKQRKQQIRDWRNIKAKFLAKISSNPKDKTSHVPFNTKIIFLENN